VKIADRLDFADGARSDVLSDRPDGLAKRVFNPALPRTDALKYYISAPVEIAATERYGMVLDTTLAVAVTLQGLGQYEAVLYAKTLQELRRIVCIMGEMGGGKTFTLEYLLQGAIKEREHCPVPPGKCPGNRLVAVFDFNEQAFMYVQDEEIALQKLSAYVVRKLRAALRSQGMVGPNEELTAFWDYELATLSDDHYRSDAFDWIADELDEESAPDETEHNLSVRRKVLAQLRTHTDLYLDYLCRLLRYVKRTRYDDREGCVLVIFDNVDRASPVIQRVLMHLVMAHADTSNALWILLMRPETFEAGDWSTHVIDRIPHFGPQVFDVLMDRLDRFCKDPTPYFREEKVLTRIERDDIVAWMTELSELLRSEDYRPVREFLTNASGHNIRYGLVLAQTLVRMGHSKSAHMERTPHNIIRALIRQGAERYRRRVRFPIENLFSIDGEVGAFLVKPRILQYLLACDGGRSAVSMVRSQMDLFGHSERVTRLAVNELMAHDKQLVRSNSHDVFRSDSEFSKAEDEALQITAVGEAYGKSLEFDLTYVHEVMVDCSVRADAFGPRTPYGTLAERLMAFARFVKLLLNADGNETLAYTNSASVDDFTRVFGDKLLVVQMVEAMDPVRRRIIASIHEKHPGIPRDTFASVEQEFASLRTQAYNMNLKVLGIEPA